MHASISRFTPVLLAGLAVLATACSATGSASGTVTATVTATATATDTVTVSPAPAKPNGAPLCATTQLVLRIGGGLVSGGEDIYYIYFKNTGTTACVLRGYPGVSAVTRPDGSASQIGSDAKRTPTSPVTTQLLKPGRTVQATLQFARTGNFVLPQCHHVNVVFLKIFPPGDTTAAYAGVFEQVCAETTLPTMTIATVVPDP